MQSADKIPQISVQSAELFHLIVENVRDYAVFVTDTNGIIVSWNPGVERLLGYTENEILGQSIALIFTPEDVAAGIPLLELEKAAQAGCSEDKRWQRRKDGSRLWVNETLLPLQNADGKLHGFAKIMRDETAQKQAEENLKQVLSGITDSFYRFDRDFRYIYVNQAATEMFGFAESEFLGKTLWDLFPDAAGNKFHREIVRALEEQKTIIFENYYPPLDRWFENRVYPSADGLSVFTTEITGRKRTETELRESEIKYRTLFDSIDEGFCVIEVLFDETGKAFDYMFLEVNSAFEKQSGLENARGKRLREFVPDYEPFWFETYGRVALTGEAVRFDNYSEAFNRWWDVYAFRVGGSDSRRVAVLFNNITERKQAETALRKAEERYRALIEATSTTVWHATPTGALSFVGKHWTEVSGQSVEEILKWGWLEALHPDDRERTIEVWQTSLANKTLYSTEFRILTVSGEYRWFAVNAVPILEADGNVREWIGINTDIDEQKRLDLRNRFIIEVDEEVRPLETPEEITQTLARLLGEYLGADRCAYAVVETDENHFYIPGDYTREDTQSIVGYYSMSDFGAEVLRLMRANQPYIVNNVDTDPQVTESDLAAYRATAIQAVICVPLHKNNRFSACMAVHQKQPRRWLPEEIQLVTFVANRFWESIERARVLKSLHESLLREQEARLQAEHANRLKDEFLATLSHELRTPLNAILGWAQMLHIPNLTAGETAKALATIERNAKSQAQLIDDILDVSRIITGKLRLEMRAVDLPSVISAAIDAARPAAEAKNITLQIRLDAQAGAITGDTDRLQQVVWNLLSNAIKFTPKDGLVEIKLEKVDSHIEIVIRDTGKGIEPEFLPHVFDRFRQSDGSMTRRHGGLGLGLAIVRQLVELHGGTVSVKSAGSDKGSTFTINLPIISVRRKETANDIESEFPTAQTGIKADFSNELCDLHILVVDDEPDSRELLYAVLDSCGAKVMMTGSAVEAFEAVKCEKFDVIISDIGMPEEDGFSLIRKIRALDEKQGGKIPAIALTAYARAEDRINSLRAGFQMHVAKPVEPSELVAVIVNLTR